MVDSLGLSYRNTRELNRIIDEEMPGRPRFKCEEVSIGGESFDFYFREVIPSLRALFGDPRFSKHLAFAPEHHYQDASHTTQVFSEMYTGKWWWSVQVHPLMTYILSQLLTLSSGKPGVTQTRRDSRASHHLNGQDPAHSLSIEERLPNLLNNRQHSKIYS